MREYIEGSGWRKSFNLKESINGNGKPLPWYTYPAINMLSKMKLNNLRVFEYGSGNSTKWWLTKTKSINSVEHIEGWFKKLNLKCIKLIPKNSAANKKHYSKINTSYDKDGISYACEIFNYEGNFDIIIIDGISRVTSTFAAVQKLNENGFIIFDNSDRKEYGIAYKYLYDNGFARIDFFGPGPINEYGWCTSLFVKNLNPFR